jgi:hypothetical protein
MHDLGVDAEHVLEFCGNDHEGCLLRLILWLFAFKSY